MNSQQVQTNDVGNQAERTRPRQTLVPEADIYETAESIVLLVDIPGVGGEQLNITLENDVLTIDGTTDSVGRNGLSLVHREYGQADYRRQFTLSTDVERDGISATVKDGVLTLVLPKAAPARARKIDVRAA